MSRDQQRILLVEGKSDEAFYSEICKLQRVNAGVKVAPPKELGGNFNSKEGVFNFLPTQLKQLSDGRIERLAVVVDADHQSNHGLGFQSTVGRVAAIVKPYGFSQITRQEVPGILFESADGLPDFGLWVMPDNCRDGMLEDWIQTGIAGSESALMLAARTATEALAEPKFKPIHLAKAEVAVWLGWQTAPGMGLDYAIRKNLVDHESQQFGHFIGWLKHVFS